MNRTKKLKLNSSVSLLARVVIIISGLILPRLILSNYGVEIHGLVNSINQFLGIITFLDLGVGAVVKSALYRPLVTRNRDQLNSIMIASKKYFQKIAYILIIYVAVLILFYPLLVDSSHSYLSTVFLISALSISKFGQYYFGIVNELLLNANQQNYIQLGSEILVVILNLFISILLIYLGASIQIVKLGSGIIFLVRPLFLKFYVNKHFNIDYSIIVYEDPIPQRWNGLGQHVAYSIQNNTDVVILTFFSTIESISVYSIYYMVISAIKMLVSSLTTGIQSFFGELYANNEITLLNTYFDRIEWTVHIGVIYLYGITTVLINPFVMIYTSGVEGISYDVPLFSLFLVLASVAYSIRVPYNSMVLSAGHFRQTQVSSYIEASLNIFISIFLVNRYGLVGVAIGTLVSMIYRTLYLVIYLSKNIVFRPIITFIKLAFVDFVSYVSIIILGSIININNISTLIDWVSFATIFSVISLILLIIINLIFYNNFTIHVIKKLFKGYTR